MGHRTLFLSTLLALAPLLNSQDSAPKTGAESSGNPAAHLEIVKSVKVESLSGGSIQMPIKCDDDGNIYLRFSDSPDLDTIPIVKIDKDGKQAAVYRDQFPDIKPQFSSDIAIGDRGEVFEVTFGSVADNRYITEFKKDGSYKSSRLLGTPFDFSPYHMAAMAKGEFLVTGVKKSSDKADAPFTGIFSDDGSLVREVTLQTDEEIKKGAQAGDNKIMGKYGFIRAIGFGWMQTANDGNVYIMRRLSPAAIYAVSPSGEVVKSFTVAPSNAEDMPRAFHVSKNSMAILFRADGENKPAEIKVVDLEGNDVGDYQDPTGALGPSFACYSADKREFTFIGFSDGRMALNIAQPR